MSIGYLRFRNVVKDLINDHYRIEASDSKMMEFESMFIENATQILCSIYIEIAWESSSKYFVMRREDLLRFVKERRPEVKIEELKLYAQANDTLSSIYEELLSEGNADAEPEDRIYSDFPGVSKELLISTEMFRIRKKDLPGILEDIDEVDPFGLKDKLGEGKTGKNKINFEKDKKPENDVEESIEIDNIRNLLKYKRKEAELEPKQIDLFELLWKNKDEIVKRSDIDKVLWAEIESQYLPYKLSNKLLN
ncbi:MAG: hypothetical protein ACYSTS_07765 [Planctomycetota bacterium]|jgi:hypothetical protein